MSKNSKPVTKKSAVRLTGILGAVGVVLLALVIAVPILANYFEGVLRDFFGEAGGSSTVVASDDDLDAQYNSSNYGSFDELYAVEQAYVRQAAGEAFVLLKNDGGLPIETSSSNKAKIALFSQSSVDFIIGGTGSGTSSTKITLKDAFEDANYEVNEDLWNYYSNNGNSRGAVSLWGASWALNEIPLSTLQSRVDNFSSIQNGGTTAIFIMSRTGGEGSDEARRMGSYGATTEDQEKSYLEPDSVELEIIDYLDKNFTNVILVVNTNNVMELGWVENYSHLNAVIWAPGGGDQAAYGLADIICGKVTPSGHLVDTFAYDNFSSPAMQNMGDIRYTNGGSNTNYYGISYDEGIYVGYKYYETRYYDAVMGQGNATSSAGVFASAGSTWNYAEEVMYPFGYGMSYTTFDWSDFNVTYDGDDTFTVSVKVTNTGDYDGKEVVEVYLNSPYTEYDKTNHIEKAAASLVGFGKTGILSANGGSETVEIEVSMSDFATYDDVGEKTYIIEAGQYLLTAATDAHEAVNNFLAYEGEEALAGGIMTANGDTDFVYAYNQSALDNTTYAVSASGAKVTNRFESAAASTASTVTSNCNYIDRTQYLTRQDWDGSWPVTHGNQDDRSSSSYNEVNGYTYKEEISSALLSKLQQSGTAEAANSPISDSSITAEMAGEYGVEGDLELIDYRGLAYEDADWFALTSQMTTSEMGKIINLSGYATAKADSINKPKAVDLDGPAGLNQMVGQNSYSIAYCTEVGIAATWNTEMGYYHGYYTGQDGLTFSSKVNGWYAPAMNIHRTPFAGRNFEYYSEDAYISGVMGSQATYAAAESGMYSFVKHFALNDQETHRDSNGVCSWCNEQAMREIYLKPFRMVSECGTVEERYYAKNEDGSYVTDENGNVIMATTQMPAMQAVMTSFNRVGATWAGGSYQLLTEILREEWGFNGFVLTDYSQGATGYMHTEQEIRAGGDAQLTQYGSNFKASTNANIYYTKVALSHVLYTVGNSNAMNGFVHGVEAAATPFAYYILVEIALEIVFAAGIVLCVVFVVRRWRNYSKVNSEDNPN